MGELEPKKTDANVNVTLCALPARPPFVPKDNFRRHFGRINSDIYFYFARPMTLSHRCDSRDLGRHVLRS